MEKSGLLVAMKGITKHFPGVVALNNVDLELNRGEVLSVLGENGAGKSTLIKILSGAYKQDKGDIYIGGIKQQFASPREANEMGVSIIYQELNYLSDLTVAENIFINRYPQKNIFATIDWKIMKKDAKAVLDKLKVDISPSAIMRELSVAEKQLVEIAKAISQNMKILIMDEPTSALSEKESDRLFELVRQLKDSGTGVIFISHRLHEIFKIADRVQIMRDGERVGNYKINDTSREMLVQLMVGRKVENFYPKREILKKDIVLKVSDLFTDYLKAINFYVRSGEILGVFGLMGSGRAEMASTVFGSFKKNKGEIEVNGKKIDINSPKDAIKAGLAYVTSDRKSDGLILIQNVMQNIMTASIDAGSTPFRINSKKEKRRAEFWKDKFLIRTPSIITEVNALSGGNQQKVVLAKWLETNPKVMIMNEPTRGIDVGAKSEIYNLIEEFCEIGLGVVMISSELPELLQLADRVIVLCEGRISVELSREDLCQEKMMNGAIGEACI